FQLYDYSHSSSTYHQFYLFYFFRRLLSPNAGCLYYCSLLDGEDVVVVGAFFVYLLPCALLACRYWPLLVNSRLFFLEPLWGGGRGVCSPQTYLARRQGRQLQRAAQRRPQHRPCPLSQW
ncbi:unnamed protein product, partial [Heterosigma akashiwo]